MLDPNINLVEYALKGGLTLGLIALLGIIVFTIIIKLLRFKLKAKTKPNKEKTPDPTLQSPQKDSVETAPKAVAFTQLDVPNPSINTFILHNKLNIGRSKQYNDWAITDDTISSKHCQLYLVHDTIYLIDVGSKNGTTVNDIFITQPTQLNNLAILQMGASRYQVKIG